MGIRVILADDHPIVLYGLCRLLEHEADIQVVGMATNGRAVVELTRSLQPDVVLLDVTMPDLNGVMATQQILATCKSTRVVALSMHSASHVVAEMTHAGAAGYITKTCSIDQIIKAVRSVAAGGTYFSPEVADHASAPVAHGGALSPREREVLQLVAEGKTSKEIASRLFITTKTVEWHRKSIMDKLNIRTVAELTKYAIREGLTMLEC